MHQNLLLSLVKFGKLEQISSLTIMRLLAHMPQAFFFKNYLTLAALDSLLQNIHF